MLGCWLGRAERALRQGIINYCAGGPRKKGARARNNAPKRGIIRFCAELCSGTRNYPFFHGIMLCTAELSGFARNYAPKRGIIRFCAELCSETRNYPTFRGIMLCTAELFAFARNYALYRGIIRFCAELCSEPRNYPLLRGITVQDRGIISLYPYQKQKRSKRLPLLLPIFILQIIQLEIVLFPEHR